jgi:hypothetical protein
MDTAPGLMASPGKASAHLQQGVFIASELLNRNLLPDVSQTRRFLALTAYFIKM